MPTPPSRQVAKRLIVVAVIAVLLVAVAILVLGLAPMYSAMVALLVALVVTLWLLAGMRIERARLALEVDELETSALLMAERLRVAREVHDLVSHGLGMITVRASSTLHLEQSQIASTPSTREQTLLSALTDIELISREATNGLRRTIQALRDPAESAALRPAEDLTALVEIVAQAQAAGLTVDARYGELSVIPPCLHGAIVALIREGLANAARHAGPTSVTVEITTAQGVNVSIRDAGPAENWTAPTGSGHGILGLREQIDSLSGTLHAGASPTGTGYELRAAFRDLS